MCDQLFKDFIVSPTIVPAIIPYMISFMIMIKDYIGDLIEIPMSLKAKAELIPKQVIAKTSLNVALTINVLGIFFFTPNPFICKAIIPGTMMAGDTAAITQPKLAQKDHGIMKINLEQTATMAASAQEGSTVIIMTVRPTPLNSSSNPPRNKTTHKHTYLAIPAQPLS